MHIQKAINNYTKLPMVALLFLITSTLQACHKDRGNNTEDNNSYVVTGETIALSSQNTVYLLKKDANVKSVYKIGMDSVITKYQLGVDYLLTNNGGIQRTATSSIPDFSTQKVILNADGKFTFVSDPNRNPQVPILWQVMVDYSTDNDSLIYQKSNFLSDKLKSKLKSKQDISIYCTGTSISAGANTVPVFYNNKNTVAYVYLIAKAITKLYGNKVTVTNLAIGGSDAQLLTSQLDQIKLGKPDLVFIEFGMNEHTASNRDIYLAAIENGVKTLTAGGIDCSLVGFFQQNPQWDAEIPASTIYFNNQLREISMRNHVFFSDIYNAFEQIPKEKLYKDLMGDYMHHPTDFGHKVYYLSTVPLVLFDNKKESDLLKIIEK